MIKTELKSTKLIVAVVPKKAAQKKQEYTPYQFCLRESSDLMIYATDYLDFKPKGFDTHIKLALKNK